MKLSKPSRLSRIVLNGLLVTSLVAPYAARAQNDELDNLFEQEEARSEEHTSELQSH